MEQIDVPVRDLRRLYQPLTALKTLLEAATSQVGVPADTRHCLQAMEACLRELSDACMSLEPTTATRIEQATGTSDAPAVHIGALELRGSTLRELLGADLLEQLELGASRSTTLGPTDPGHQTPVPSRREHAPRQARVSLTPQEQRILELVAQGCTNRQIAARLYLAEKTVKNYVSNMLRKLGMERRTQAAVYAIQLDRDVLAEATSGGGA